MRFINYYIPNKLKCKPSVITSINVTDIETDMMLQRELKDEFHRPKSTIILRQILPKIQ